MQKSIRDHRINFLKKIPLFKSVQTSTLQKIADQIVERKVHNRDTIYFSGEESEFIYIIRYGEAVVRFPNSGEIYLGPGEVLAEVSVITGLRHSGTATASIDCLIYEIKGSLFIKMAEEDRMLSKNLISLLSGRFKENLNINKNLKIPRRFIVHIKLDSVPNFPTEVEKVAKTCEIAVATRSIILPATDFKDLNAQATLIKFSDFRTQFPIIHIRIDDIHSIKSYEHLVFQADFIVFYEIDQESGWSEKLNYFNRWKEILRNYEGRVIRHIVERGNLHSFLKSEKEKIFTNSDLLGRFLVSRTRGLTLGGGGARALAHVGLLKVLEKENLRFDYISGSSMGAVIGALYARGESAASIETYVKKFFGGLESPFDPRIPIVSFYKGKKMKRMLKEAFRDDRIEDYPIPFVTSAVDLQTGEEYIFDKGPLWEALLCAMSLPAVFPPVFVGDHLLVDGGIINNVPDNLIRKIGADKILCINVSPLKDKEIYQILEDRKLTGTSFFRSIWQYIMFPPILRILSRANTLEGREITKARVSKMDSFINFHLEEFGLFDFGNYKQIIEKGEQEAISHLKEIQNLFFPNP